jgi:hypothetical protein
LCIKHEALWRGKDLDSLRSGAPRRYSPLLREHILKENEVLLVMAEPLLTDDEQREFPAAFDAVETERMGAGTHERLHARMDKEAADIASDKPARQSPAHPSRLRRPARAATAAPIEQMPLLGNACEFRGCHVS